MEKVTLPKEVAESIGIVRANYKSGAEYDLELIHNEGFGYTRVISEFVKESRENMALYFKALVNGYEVEQTPEDKVREMFKATIDEVNDLDDHPQAEWWRSRRKSIIDTLNALNIKIEGVNT